MTNIYWPVYQNLEREVEHLTFAIHIDDAQLAVYSSKITDLVLRAAADIESLAKELYFLNGGLKKGKIKFDYDGLDHLIAQWKIDRKKVIISATNSFQSDRVITPFIKKEHRTSDIEQVYSGNGELVYGWNNAYQNLKHDRGNSIKFGSLKYLFEIMAALYVLNIYYRDESFDLEKDHAGNSFQANVGSLLFSVDVAIIGGHDGKGKPIIPDDFDEAIYYIDWTPETGRKLSDSMAEQQKDFNSRLVKHPKILAYAAEGKLEAYTGNNLAFDVLGEEDYITLLRLSTRAVKPATDQLLHHAVLNKGKVTAGYLDNEHLLPINEEEPQ